MRVRGQGRYGRASGARWRQVVAAQVDVALQLLRQKLEGRAGQLRQHRSLHLLHRLNRCPRAGAFGKHPLQRRQLQLTAARTARVLPSAAVCRCRVGRLGRRCGWLCCTGCRWRPIRSRSRGAVWPCHRGRGDRTLTTVEHPRDHWRQRDARRSREHARPPSGSPAPVGGSALPGSLHRALRALSLQHGYIYVDDSLS